MSRGKFDTRELLDEYFKTRPETTVRKIRSQIDRQELYDFERKIGKPLVDMDAMEVAEMIKTFTNKSFSTKVYKVSFRTYDTILSFIRDFFNWYIDNHEVIKNPCNDKRIKGRNVLHLFEDTTDIFTKDSMEDAIQKIRDTQIDEYADYQEAIIRMFYEGFPESIDIVNLKEEDVNHEKKTAIVRGREIQLSDRLYELLKKINRMEDYPAYRGSYMMMSYRGSYFKFPTREKFKGEFNERPPEYWASYISRIFNREIKIKLDININARTLYLRGFYDYIVENYGQEETDRIIMSVRSPEDAKKMMAIAEKYGVQEQNVTTLKKLLMQFVAS